MLRFNLSGHKILDVDKEDILMLGGGIVQAPDDRWGTGLYIREADGAYSRKEIVAPKILVKTMLTPGATEQFWGLKLVPFVPLPLLRSGSIFVGGSIILVNPNYVTDIETVTHIEIDRDKAGQSMVRRTVSDTFLRMGNLAICVKGDSADAESKLEFPSKSSRIPQTRAAIQEPRYK